MVRKIIWTSRAQREKKEIFSYWNRHNQSNLYSKKLNELFHNEVKLLQLHPYIGRETDIQNVHIKIVRQFLVFYEVTETEIVILTIRDGRRNPEI